MTNNAVFPDAARTTLATLYPEQPGILAHRLAGHPLFTLDALVALAGRMRGRVHRPRNRIVMSTTSIE